MTLNRKKVVRCKHPILGRTFLIQVIFHRMMPFWDILNPGRGGGPGVGGEVGGWRMGGGVNMRTNEGVQVKALSLIQYYKSFN
jgi:hypothetical protein